MLSRYRHLLELRRREPSLSVGSYTPLAASGTVLAYLREFDGRRLAVVLNLGSAPARWTLPVDLTPGRVLATATGRDVRAPSGDAEIPADEALVFEVTELGP